MKQHESKTDVTHNACSVCECTVYVERELARRLGGSWDNFAEQRQQPYLQQQPQQRPPPQQQKIRRSDGSWFYYSSSTYVMPAEDTGVQDQHQQQGDGYKTDDHDNAANTDDVVGDYEF
ncbi:MAG: hypothetical protein M3275_00700 [Thermoproteota archaeon]|nr:hypothetical protein [Thermoproteota archaeon]MDQ3966896.1 hypothetical protein [Thermoproteota archaeon]